MKEIERKKEKKKGMKREVWMGKWMSVAEVVSQEAGNSCNKVNMSKRSIRMSG